MAASKDTRLSWLDDKAESTLIDDHVQQLQSFMDAMADGHIDEKELTAQEQRLVALMKEVEPQLDATQHAKITQLLCELTAYNIMQTLHSLQGARPQQQEFKW